MDYQWKMPFNPDQAKQVQEVISLGRTNSIIHHSSNNAIVKFTDSQKHHGSCSLTR